MNIRTLSYMYHSSFRLWERDSVDCLPAPPFLVANADSREELQNRVNVRNFVQPLQDTANCSDRGCLCVPLEDGMLCDVRKPQTRNC